MHDFRSRLKNLAVLRPLWHWTQGRLARQTPWRAFVSWQEYYADYLRTDGSHALIQHSGPYVGSSAHQTELLDQMAGGRGPALVWAPPGCGKSRFALELARRIERTHPRWHVVFVRHDETAVREELQHLLQLKRVVFIVDDAHDCPEIIELLAASCAPISTPPPHLVCLTRSTRRVRVTRALNDAFPPGIVQEVDLGRPTPQLVRTLIDQLLSQSSPHHRDTIARFVRQSYFGAVLVCGILRREGKLPQTFQRQDLRDRIRREPLRQAIDGVCPVEAALRALAVYSALTPAPKASAEVGEWAARLSGLTPAAVAVLTDRVLETGLFQEYGSGLIRPMPDLLGDLILEEACLDTNGKPTPFSTQLLEPLLMADPVATVRNCADIGQLFGAAQDTDLISSLVLERARTIQVGNQWDTLELLRMTQPLAARRPATAVELARILESRGILSRSPAAAESFSDDSIEMATLSLLMSAGEVDPAAIPVALGLGRDLYVASREDARRRQFVLDKLKTYCRFERGRGLAHAQTVVATLRAWVGESNVEAAALCASLSAQFLTLAMEGQHLWTVRDAATDTLVRAMTHAEATVQCAAIESLELYADYQGTPDQPWLDRWSPQLARETERLSAAIIKLTKESARLAVSAAAELQGWRWWARQQDVLHHAGGAILRAIPDTDAYRLWKLLYAPRLPVRAALPEPPPPRPQERLQHVQALANAREEDAIAQARQVFDTLDARHADSGAWHALWLVVLQQSPPVPANHAAGVVVGEFARRHPEVAWSFVNQAHADGPMLAVLPFLLVELGKLDRARRSREARNVPAGTRLEEAWLRALSLTSDFDEPERAILARGLQSADSETVHRAADALLAAGGSDRLTAFRRVYGVIAHHPTDSGLWELALERFVHWTEVVLPPASGKPTDGMTQGASELATLLQAYGSYLRWGFQRHTRQLAKALAIIAVVCPRRLQEWIQRDWGQAEAAGGRWSDESPLSVGRLPEVMRLLAGSPAATPWIEIFIDWMKRNPRLGGLGALGLAELCALDDSRVGELEEAIRAHPTDASLHALTDFVNQRKRRERPNARSGTTD